MNTHILAYISLIIVSIVLLVRSIDFIEDSFVYIAHKLRINEFFLGFAVLSIVSSLPELAIAINSRDEVPDLSIGNLFGATLILLTLVIGLTVIRFGDVKFTGKFGEKEIITALLIIALGPLSVYDRKITFTEGIILILAYAVYLIHIYSVFKRNKIETKKQPKNISVKKLSRLFSKAVGGTILLFISSSLIVEGVVLLGDEVSLNESLIGLFVLAIGTNTPEITMLVRSKKMSQRKLAIGNFLGSATANVPILGLLAVMSNGVKISNYSLLIPVLGLTIFTVIIFSVFSWTGKAITKYEAFFLVGIYGSLVVSELILIGYRGF